jgi:predicted transposase YbfD/YdcC
MATAALRFPNSAEQHILQHLEVRLLGDEATERERYRQLMEEHHYLKSDTLVGEQLRYVVQCEGQWLALLSWSAAAKHLKDRDHWVGWTSEQRRRRLALLANNARFLILPEVDCPNLASRALALCTARLSQDWQEAYGHPILLVESFVDSQLFRGTAYKAQGWQLLGQTRGFERCRQDYYTEHGRPKQLWVRALHLHARHWLSSQTLPADLQHIADQVIPLPLQRATELRGLVELCGQVPDWRKRKGLDYPLRCLLAITVLASLCGVARGQRDLAAFASKLTQAQLRTLRSYRKPDGTYDFPKETTFQRMLAKVNAAIFERVLQQWEDQQLGRHSLESDCLVAIDGKAQRGSSPQADDTKKPQLVSAESLPSGRVLGTEAVEEKSNEIPAARRLLERIGPLDGKLVMLDALHTNQSTLSQIHQDNGADYLLPVKGNQQGLEERAAACLPPKAVPEPTQSAATTKGAGSSAKTGISPLGQRPQSRSIPAAKAVRYRRQRRS